MVITKTIQSFPNQKAWMDGEVKQRHQERLERDLNTNNTKDMWKVIQTITGYKNRSV